LRVLGVVSELQHSPGVYGRQTAVDSASLDKAKEAYTAHYKTLLTLSGVALAVSFEPLPLQFGRWLYRRAFAPPAPIERLGDSPPSVTADGPIGQALVIPAAFLQNDFRDYDDPHLYGLPGSSQRWKALMTAEASHVDLWIVSQATAEQSYRHFGGERARFSRGLHVPHPKDPTVLVPLEGIAQALLAEVRHEWVRAFEALGARRIVIADSTNAKGGGGGRAPVQGVDVAAELRIKYGSSNVDEHTYGPGTFDPGRATAGARWLGDHPAIRNVVDGRVHGSQTAWRREQTVDAAFGLDVKALGAFGLGISGDYQRRFEICVEFYPTPAGGSAHVGQHPN